MTLELGHLGPDVVANAEPTGWTLRLIPGSVGDLSRREGWPPSALEQASGVSVALQTEMLLDLELADVSDSAVVVPWERFADVLREDISLPLQWTVWSPLMLSIDRVSEIGRSDFQYRYAYRFGARETAVDRVGYFVRRRSNGQIYHLDEQTYALVDSMDRFNAMPSAERTPASAWLTFSQVKGCSTSVGANLDAYLRSNDVVVPSQIALDIFVHEDDSISFVPRSPGIPDKEFREAFLSHRDADGLYVLDAEGGQRVRIVLSDRHRQVLERMKQVRRVSGRAKEEARRNPAQFFDGLLDAIEIQYGPRVIGIGDFPFASVPASQGAGGDFFAGAGQGEAPRDRERPDRPAAITLPRPDGDGDVTLVLKDPAAIAAARDAVAAAIDRGESSAIVQGQRVTASIEVLEALALPPVEVTETESTERAKGRKFLLVYTNEDDLREADAAAAARASVVRSDWPSEPRLPMSLRADVQLKQHQRESLLWMQRCEMIADRRGLLLADDMGLGKTLQILAFLASRIEAGRLRWNSDADDDAAPWRPILIMAPLILVENETWVAEMRQFFAHDGELFHPILVLHGSGIDQVRAGRTRGGETSAGRPLLSADKLMQYRTVITNYETVVNYQHSLAQLKDGRSLWSAVITDEAQKYKAMNTKVSTALKAIAGDFHIASTGTPVENRLLDLWNIVDTIQPALLGSATEFSVEYEHKLGGDEEDAALEELRRKLLFKQPHAFIVRRSKEDVLHDLPEKGFEILRCDMTPAERGLHAELIGALGRERPLGRHLAVLHKLTRLYQHPALLRGDWDQRPVPELVAESPKLAAVIRQLHAIRRSGEKAIIFARHLDAQQLLARAIGEEFRTNVSIINGTTSRGKGFNSSSGATARAKNERKRILDEFREQPGFAVIILSPFVAGIGLTITEANHVIHYGRWWNPAVEAQATDRAYRIGQTRPVTVYLPILHDPTGQVARSFDECLQGLLERKTALARDFLQPADAEEQNASELCAMLDGDGVRVDAAVGIPFTAADLDGLAPADFEASVAALYRARGYRVVLTAKGSDGGADVLAFRDGETALIQAKHSAGRQSIDPRALNDVLAACDVYGAQLPARWKAVVISNAPMAADTRREAQSSGIELVAGDRLARLMTEAGIGIGAMAAAAAARCTSFAEGVRQARAFVTG